MRSLRRTIPGALLAAAFVLGPAAAGAQETPGQTTTPPECREVNVTNSFTNMEITTDPDVDEAEAERDCRVALAVARETMRFLGDMFGFGGGLAAPR